MSSGGGNRGASKEPARGAGADGVRASREPASEGDRPPRGYSWPPAEAGNTLALKHGALSRYVIPEADELARAVLEAEEVAPHLTPADAPAVRDWAIAQVRAWRLAVWIEANGELDAKGNPRPALKALSDWISRASGLRARIGLDPPSRAGLAVDTLTARAQAAALARQELEQGKRLRQQAERRALKRGEES